MKARRGENVLFVLLVLTSFGFLATFGQSSELRSQNEIVLGGFFSLHERDEFPFCKQPDFRAIGNAEAMVYAVEEINKNSSLLSNFTLTIAMKDTCGAIDEGTVESAMDFMTRNYMIETSAHSSCAFIDHSTPISAVVGPSRSSSSKVVANLFNSAQLPFVSFAATSDELSSPLYTSFHRSVSSDHFVAQAFAEIMVYYNWSYVAAIAVDDSYGRAGLNDFKREAEKRNICLAIFDFLPHDLRQDAVRILVKQLKEQTLVKAVVVYTLEWQAKWFFDEIIAQGVKGKVFIGADGWIDSNHLYDDVKYNDVLTGSIGVLLRNYDLTEYEKYIKRLRVNNSSPSYLVDYFEAIHNCTSPVRSPVNGIRPCSLNDSVTDSLFSKHFTSIYSPYVIDAVYGIAHALSRSLETHRDPKNNLELLSFRKPKMLMPHLSEVRFQSIGGHMTSLERDSSLSAWYDIISYSQETNTLHGNNVGLWSTSRLQIDNSAITWPIGSHGIPSSVCSLDCQPGHYRTTMVGCCWTCVQCPARTYSLSFNADSCITCERGEVSDSARVGCVKVPIEAVNLTDPSSLFIISLIACFEIIIFASCYCFLVNWKTPVAKASNAGICLLLLVFVAVATAVPSLCTFVPTWLTCAGRLVVPPILYTAMQASLLIKTNTVVSVFEKSFKAGRAGISSYQFTLILVITLPQVSVAVAWLLYSPPFVAMDYSRKDAILPTCTSETMGTNLRYAMLAYLGLVSFTGIALAFRARKLPKNFQEAKFILFSMYFLALDWIVLFTLQTLAQTKVFTILESVFMLLSPLAIFFCIFVPKLILLTVDKHKNTERHILGPVHNFSFKTVEKNCAPNIVSL